MAGAGPARTRGPKRLKSSLGRIVGGVERVYMYNGRCEIQEEDEEDEIGNKIGTKEGKSRSGGHVRGRVPAGDLHVHGDDAVLLGTRHVRPGEGSAACAGFLCDAILEAILRAPRWN